MAQEFFTVTVFLTVSSLAWGQYGEMNRPEPNHCQLRPDRRRCTPTFLPRWYFNPFKGNCYLFQYGGCHGNRNNFMSREECLDKCGQPPPPNDSPPPQSSPPVISDDDTEIEAYVERCKAPADTGPCRARMNKWYYDAGKRRCFPFIYGGCRGNSNKYDSEDECMRKCAISVNNRFASPYQRNGPPNGDSNFRERSLPGRPPLRRSIRNPRTRGTFFRTFFPLIWQVSIPKGTEVKPSVPGSPRPEDLEMMKTTGVAMSQEVTTPVNVEVTKDTTTQPPKGMMEITGIQASTTPPARLEEEEINRRNGNNEQAVGPSRSMETSEEDNVEYNGEEPNEEVEMDDRNVREEEEGEMSKDNDVEEKSLEGENEEQGWKTSREAMESSEEKEENESPEYDYNDVEENSMENEGTEKLNEDSRERNEDYDVDNGDAERVDGKDEPEEDEAEEKSSENDQESNEDENEKEEEEKMARLNLQRTRGPIIRFLIRSPSRYNRPSYRGMFRQNRPGPVRRLDYRKLHYGPQDMSSEDRFDNFGRYPKFNRPTYTPLNFNRQRRIRYWRGRDNRTPKRGISFTQVFVNKPPHPPILSRHPLLPPHPPMVGRHPMLPMPMHPYPMNPYHSPAVFRYPGVGYSRSFSIQGRQQSGSPPHVTGSYQATRWPASGPATQVQVNFVPRIGEPNLACIQPPAVYRCLFGIPSTTPFWYFDARIGKCAVFYFAGCGATLNRFNSRLECETTCMVTSPRPEITPTSEESTDESMEQSTTESLEVVDEKSNEQKTEEGATTAPDIEALYVKDTEEKENGNEEPENAVVEGTIELSKTHKVHILHELTDKDNLLGTDKSGDLEYVMVVGIVCLSGVALLILVSLGLMYMFKKFQNASSAKAFPKPKRDTVIEAVLKAHLQPTALPKIVCPVPLGPPNNTSL